MDKRIIFLFTLYLIGRKIRSHYKNKNEDGMLTAAILNLLYQQGETVTKLAHKLSTKVSAISEKIMTLEKEKLVKKMKVDDGREVFVELTQEGKNKIANLITIMQKHCSFVTQKLTDKEIRTVLPILGKLTDS
ncbi:hypothetical protein A2334_04210 [Candidatus Roizmanbacteria bacterium RIFOXYB2_FULL_38_10]|uniref:HTH marR-type domain-containing protein n=1 Tax=Candidatus Roizmanbacteria bacterium RIFOXYD1_FULL_38_12 TaxID=1802093 RepID=A0A1F7KZD7_9BACT|nr:MAG: hypothetical protein A3K47_00320 [Candidatus Roizmanbacteria bacterium RIFOXYA2_FULL_38_14]OGK63246.1 MAG: hypothetical protein A3K27_00320 [Candidatus Roizmanbacteria bacterium RIFOXYA1_FULL_37_12]OGK65092.1 MAG: hypothetical protein A3K38_00320 [Candidatus Roizmanbacteria bacterium RIFOXYB1_FULL_40_23]OGK68646.1 MAG: hypothetical protein A2334_04210 [Candidatus Roizmanbacteria bacterium RIFOXYB2_FULL_38_10]OGK69496.1 MAG: hypothetical protein A3K21_00320 [Candidatus Roizmanbacteria ba